MPTSYPSPSHSTSDDSYFTPVTSVSMACPPSSHIPTPLVVDAPLPPPHHPNAYGFYNLEEIPTDSDKA